MGYNAPGTGISGGTANANSALSYGVYANGSNPAGIAYPGDNSYKIIIMFPNIWVCNNPAIETAGWIVDAARGLNLEQSAFSSDITEYLRSNGGRLYFGKSTGNLDIIWSDKRTYGTFGFSIRNYIDGYIETTEDFPALRDGSPIISRSGSLELEYYDIESYTLTYSKDVLESESGFDYLTMGASLRYSLLNNYAYYRMDHFSITPSNGTILIDALSELVTNQKNLTNSNSFENNSSSSYSGSGLSFDLGAVLALKTGVNIGLSLTGIGNIYTGNNLSRRAIRTHAVLPGDSRSVSDSILKPGEYSDRQFPNREINSPMCFRASFSLELERLFKNYPLKTSVYIGTVMGLVNQPFSRPRHKFSAGVLAELSDKLPYLTAGLGFGYYNNPNLSIGLGYKYEEFDLFMSCFDTASLLKPLNSVQISLQWQFYYGK